MAMSAGWRLRAAAQARTLVATFQTHRAATAGPHTWTRPAASPTIFPVISASLITAEYTGGL